MLSNHCEYCRIPNPIETGQVWRAYKQTMRVHYGQMLSGQLNLATVGWTRAGGGGWVAIYRHVHPRLGSGRGGGRPRPCPGVGTAKWSPRKQVQASPTAGPMWSLKMWDPPPVNSIIHKWQGIKQLTYFTQTSL